MTVEELGVAILSDPPLELFQKAARAIAEPARTAIMREMERAAPEDRIPLWALLVGDLVATVSQ